MSIYNKMSGIKHCVTKAEFDMTSLSTTYLKCCMVNAINLNYRGELI